jgi:hypothetical protein
MRARGTSRPPRRPALRPAIWAAACLAAAAGGAADDRAAPEAPAVLRCDLAVVGGGSAGFGAALAAARPRGHDPRRAADQLGGTSVRAASASGNRAPEARASLRPVPSPAGGAGRRRHLLVGRHQRWFDPPGIRSAIRRGDGHDPARTYLDTLQRYLPPGPTVEAWIRRTMPGSSSSRGRWTRQCAPCSPTPAGAGCCCRRRVPGGCRVRRVTAIRLADGRRIAARLHRRDRRRLCASSRLRVRVGEEARDRFQEPDARTARPRASTA